LVLLAKLGMTEVDWEERMTRSAFKTSSSHSFACLSGQTMCRAPMST
jgi:hypothetical protein